MEVSRRAKQRSEGHSYGNQVGWEERPHPLLVEDILCGGMKLGVKISQLLLLTAPPGREVEHMVSPLPSRVSSSPHLGRHVAFIRYDEEDRLVGYSYRVLGNSQSCNDSWHSRDAD